MSKINRAEWDKHSGFCPKLHSEPEFDVCLCKFIEMVKQSERDHILEQFVAIADELLDSEPNEVIRKRIIWRRLDQLIRLLDVRQ